MSMNRRTFLTTTAAGLASLAASPASGQEALDLKTFLPPDHFPALPGSMIMLVGTWHRDGAEKYYRFSADGSSWREGYIPVTDTNSLHKMEFLVGPEGEKVV